MKPVELGKQGCDAIMHKYTAQALPPKGAMFYHQGVFLSGMQNIYHITGDEKYFNYIKDYIDSVIDQEGEIYGISHEATEWKNEPTWAESLKIQSLTMLDTKQPVILLYDLLEKTGDEKYEKAIKELSESLYYWPVNNYGGYWHMMHQHHQMWMDGLYMAGPLSVMYSAKYGDKRLMERAINQAFIMDDNIKDEKTGLYYHGWDPSRQADWADKETGLSQEIWGRAVGWYAVAILDMLDYIPKDHPAVERLKQIEADLLKALAKYQDKKTGMWYQVVDKPENEDNWIETSSTCLFIYSYAKAIRTGVIGKEYEDVLEKAYNGMVDYLYYDEEGFLVVDNVCIGCCVESGTYDYYINKEKISNDLHGMGAFTLMCAEMQRYYDTK